jgi:hypothetical protein
MARGSIFAVALAALRLGAGCNSTSAAGAADGAAMIPNEAGAGLTTCAMAGGQCIAGDAICWGLDLLADCRNAHDLCCVVVFDGGSCTDANAQTIHAASYEQTCAVDKDCVAVSEGDSCNPCDFSCTNAAVNAGALKKYSSDMSNFPAVLAVASGACPSSCGDGPGGPCCVRGMCQVGNQCPFVSVLTCALGAACSNTEICTGGVAGCTSNCQCLDGKWQSPCPADLPQNGIACTPTGAACGYITPANACGAANCYCQGGTWTCEPTCIILGDSGADAGADAAGDACAASGCNGSCISGAHNVSHVVDGCLVWQCCVPDDAGPDAAMDGGPPDASGE